MVKSWKTKEPIIYSSVLEEDGEFMEITEAPNVYAFAKIKEIYKILEDEDRRLTDLVD